MENQIEIITTNKRQKCWTCTLNNPEFTDAEFNEYLLSIDQIEAFVFQREQSETGTQHFQFFVVFRKPILFTTVKQHFPRAHIEPSKGTKAQNLAYCTKSQSRIGEVYTHGTFVEERTRTDLVNMLEMVYEGKTLAEIREVFPSQVFIFQKKIVSARNHILAEKFGNIFREVKVTYIHGKTAVGKTRTIAEKFGYKNIYRVTEYDQRAFDNYDGQDIIVFEEFRGGFKIGQMLNYLDGHPVQLPCRYEDKPACYTRVFILTNLTPMEQYKEVQNTHPKTWDAFIRRIHRVYNFDNSTTIQSFINDEEIPNHLHQLTLEEDLPF
ncbi:MAG: replication protein [Firmicutes bacterium]|nr:replication protein [Bacillota bacterium]